MIRLLIVFITAVSIYGDGILYKGSIVMHPYKKTYLDKEENRIIAAKRFVTVHALYLLKRKKHFIIDPALEEHIVMKEYGRFIKNLRITSVNTVQLQKNTWNSFEYIRRSFDYVSEFDSAGLETFLSSFYSSAENIYQYKNRTYIPKRITESLNQIIRKADLPADDELDQSKFVRNIYYDLLIYNKAYFPETYWKYFSNLLKNERLTDRLHSVYFEESDRHFRNTPDDDDEAEKRKHQDIYAAEQEEDSRRFSKKTETAVRKKGSLTLTESVIIIDRLQRKRKKK